MRSPSSASATRRLRSWCDGIDERFDVALRDPVHQRRTAGELGELAHDATPDRERRSAVGAPARRADESRPRPSGSRTLRAPSRPFGPGIRRRGRNAARRIGAGARSPRAPASGTSGGAESRSASRSRRTSSPPRRLAGRWAQYQGPHGPQLSQSIVATEGSRIIWDASDSFAWMAEDSSGGDSTMLEASSSCSICSAAAIR